MMMKRTVVALLLLLQSAALHAQAASGLAVNVPVVGRLVGSGNTLFVTSIDIANNTETATQVDFYFDAVDLRTQAPLVVDGSIDATGLKLRGSGTMRGYSNVHFDDIIDALVSANMLPRETKDNGVLGSILFVFNGFTRRGQGSASARFYNDFGGGTVGVSLAGRPISVSEPRALVATVRDTRGRPGPQLYTNMFINNIGMTPTAGATAEAVNVQITARSNSTGGAIGVPITLRNIGPGQTQSVNSVLTALQVPASAEDTILVFANVTSGNSTIAGIVSTVDATTRDGAVIEMERAEP